MTALEKTVRLMGTNEASVQGDKVLFVHVGADPDDPIPSDKTELWLDRESWDAFGGPETVTLTVEPGDHLNT